MALRTQRTNQIQSNQTPSSQGVLSSLCSLIHIQTSGVYKQWFYNFSSACGILPNNFKNIQTHNPWKASKEDFPLQKHMEKLKVMELRNDTNPQTKSTAKWTSGNKSMTEVGFRAHKKQGQRNFLDLRNMVQDPQSDGSYLAKYRWTVHIDFTSAMWKILKYWNLSEILYMVQTKPVFYENDCFSH